MVKYGSSRECMLVAAFLSMISKMIIAPLWKGHNYFVSPLLVMATFSKLVVQKTSQCSLLNLQCGHRWFMSTELWKKWVRIWEGLLVDVGSSGKRFTWTAKQMYEHSEVGIADWHERWLLWKFGIYGFVKHE